MPPAAAATGRVRTALRFAEVQIMRIVVGFELNLIMRNNKLILNNHTVSLAVGEM